jgi:exonuclease VII small subunit
MKRSAFFLPLIVFLIIASTTMIVYAQDDADGVRGARMFRGEEPVACAQDARRCPDGSYVGRTGPRCEFAACPGTQENIQDRRAEFRENLEAKRGEFQARFDEFRRERIMWMLGVMKDRFLAAIERLRSIADRLEARIGKIEEATGEDLSDAQGSLREARAHLDAAEDSLEDIGTTTDLFDDETLAGERFGRLRELFAEAKAGIRAAHEDLMNALRATGRFRGSDGRPATTTSSN